VPFGFYFFFIFEGIFMKGHHSAFTLIELMIVVGIIAFLAAIALPRYTSYFDRAHQAEVAVNLASLHTAQQAYWAEHGNYSAILWGKNGIGWRPAGYRGGGKASSFFYTYGFNVPGAREGVHYFTGKLQTAKEELGKTNADTTTFTAGAAGKLKSNGAVDRWHIDESRALVHERTTS